MRFFKHTNFYVKTAERVPNDKWCPTVLVVEKPLDPSGRCMKAHEGAPKGVNNKVLLANAESPIMYRPRNILVLCGWGKNWSSAISLLSLLRF